MITLYINDWHLNNVGVLLVVVDKNFHENRFQSVLAWSAEPVF